MRKHQNVKRDDCWKERWEEEERERKGTVISWSEMMTPSGYRQDATNHQVETNNVFSFTDDLEATFDSHTLNGTME